MTQVGRPASGPYDIVPGSAGLVARHRMLSGGVRAVSGTLVTPGGGRVVPPPRGRWIGALLHILGPKWRTARARARTGDHGRAGRIALLALLGIGFWFIVFGLLTRVLRYFHSVEEIGALLAGKLLGVLLLSFLAMLMLSSVITALSSFFLAKDVDLLVSAPTDWLTLYGAKLLETAVHASWMVGLLALPILTAYGVVYDGGWLYPLIVLAGFVPFLLIPAALGSMLTLLLVNVFPARRTRDILGFIAVLAAAGVVIFVRLLRPEQLARPEGFRSLVEFISVLRGPTSPMLPNEWLQRSIMGWLTGDFDPLSVYLLWSTAAVVIVLGALAHRHLYATGFTKASESAQRWAREGMWSRVLKQLLMPLGIVRRELVLKELRLFFRDTTQWSQLILLAVLVVVYILNIRLLPLTGDGVTLFIRNLVPFLNLALAGFVLASIAARFLFPAVSLEGRTWWLLRASPLPMRDVLWAKFWMGTLPLLVLAVGIIGITNTLLRVEPFMFAVSLFTITFMTFALASLAVAFGAAYPRFETENAAQIPTSFGGLIYMMAAVALIAGIIVAEARPVYAYLRARMLSEPIETSELVIGFVLAGVLCLTATFVPLALARRRLEAIER
ncbi:MAG: putative ABC transporter permease subunit [Gemmatimonadaceae bacterium]